MTVAMLAVQSRERLLPHDGSIHPTQGAAGHDLASLDRAAGVDHATAP